jgi:hypothetical protein
MEETTVHHFLGGFWATDPDTNEDIWLYYDELGEEAKDKLLKPVGGFIWPATDFMNLSLKKVPFYIKDWLPRMGKALVYAPAKAGKSTLCLQIARQIGAGETFLSKETMMGRVLYLQFELGESVLRQRLLQTKKTYPNVWVGTNFGLKLDSQLGRTAIESALSAVEPQVLILDPWYKVFKGDENESADVRPILDYLDALIESYQCSVLIIHHAGKDISRRGRGSTVLEDWVDSYIQMTGKKDKGILTSKIKPIFLRHSGDDTELDAVLGEDFEFHLTTPEKSIKIQVAELIKAKGHVELKEILLSVKGGTTVYDALKELVAEKIIEKPSRGNYVWRIE